MTNPDPSLKGEARNLTMAPYREMAEQQGCMAEQQGYTDWLSLDRTTARRRGVQRKAGGMWNGWVGHKKGDTGSLDFLTVMRNLMRPLEATPGVLPNTRQTCLPKVTSHLC